MDTKQLVKLCSIFDDAISTNPFKEYPEMIVMRHKSNNKWFALIFEFENKLFINLKCNPVEATILRDEYSYVKPAWHMNKVHWNTVDVNKADKEVLNGLIEVSFELTKPHRLHKN